MSHPVVVLLEVIHIQEEKAALVPVPPAAGQLGLVGS